MAMIVSTHWLSRLATVFPPPRVMTLPSVGIDISDSSVKYMQFHPRGASYAIEQWGDMPIPAGVVTHGAIIDQSALVVLLKKVREVCGTPYARLSLPEGRAYLFETLIERGTAPRDIQSLLEFRMEENVPMSPRDALFDYDVLPSDVSTNMLRIAVAVYAKETVLSYYDACSAARLMPLSFETEPDAIARAAIPAEEQNVCIVLDIGKMRTGIGIVHNHALLYTSTIEIGGKSFSDALIVKFGDRDERALIKIKNERGLRHTGEADDAYEALLPPVAKLKDEVATRITYWNTRAGGGVVRPITKIILCGGAANVAGLPEYFTEALGIETERVDVWRNVPSAEGEVPAISRQDSYGYATAVGLALRDYNEARL